MSAESHEITGKPPLEFIWQTLTSLDCSVQKQEVFYKGKTIAVYYKEVKLDVLRAGSYVIKDNHIYSVIQTSRGPNAHREMVTYGCELNSNDSCKDHEGRCTDRTFHLLVPRCIIRDVKSIDEAPDHIIIQDAIRAGYKIRLYIDHYGHEEVITNYHIIME